MENTELAKEFFEAGVIKFGEFKLKSGMTSPIYLDLRVLPSHPFLFKKVVRALAQKTSSLGLEFDEVAGVPYAGIPIATALALELNKPLIYVRRKVKDYGTRKIIEGEFKKGERALVVDDLITTGESKLEAIRPLENAGLVAKDVLVVVDREQGGAEQLAARGYCLHSLTTLTEILSDLKREGKITANVFAKIQSFIQETRIKTPK